MGTAPIDDIQRLTEDEKQELVIGLVEKMSIVGLANLVKKIETKFDVKASGSGQTIVHQNQPQQQVEAPVEKTEFDLFIKAVDQARKIAIIKEVRAISGLGPKKAKDLIDKGETIVKAKMPKADAEAAKKLLEAAGATAELR